MPSILYVSTSTTMGGAEKTLRALASSLDRKRFQVAGVVSLKDKGFYAREMESDGIAVSSLGARRASLRSLHALRGAIARARPDIVHAFMYQAIQLCRAAKLLGSSGFKLASSPRVTYRARSLFSLAVDRLLRSADDMLISESEASRAYLEKSLGYDARKLLVIRNGLEPRPEPSPADRERRRRELGVSAGEILVGTVGRLDEQKGHAYLLEALARLGAVHPVAGVFVGSGPLEARLKRLAASLGLENRVRFVGEQPETASWLGAMDVFALPSLWEGLPNSLLEAMAAGLPIVATRVDGVPEAVEDGSTALLCAPGDSQALCDRMQELVLDPDLRRGLGTAAKEAAARFDIPGMIAAYEDAYAALTR